MYICDYCGQGPGKIIITVDECDCRLMCPRCSQALNTCALCTKSVACEFQTNPSPIPHQIMQTIRQGNMTMQTVITNPERVKAFCYNCGCFDTENIICRREDGWCPSYDEYIPSPRVYDENVDSVETKSES